MTKTTLVPDAFLSNMCNTNSNTMLFLRSNVRLDILYVLVQVGSATTHEVAKATQHRRSYVSKVMNDLQKAGYLESPGKVNKFKLYLLTEKGKQTARDLGFYDGIE